MAQPQATAPAPRATMASRTPPTSPSTSTAHRLHSPGAAGPAASLSVGAGQLSPGGGQAGAGGAAVPPEQPGHAGHGAQGASPGQGGQAGQVHDGT